MKIWARSESHIVELNDGSRRQIFPGDLDLTLNWNPETEINVALAEDNLGSHVLVGASAKLRVIPEGESWPVPPPQISTSRTRMAMEGRETFNLIGSDIVEGTNEYGLDRQRSVTSGVS